MVKLGIIGSSPFNGHPYSFSAIINGYSNEDGDWGEWMGILNYLRSNFPENKARDWAQVTHVWSQHPGEAKAIAKASNIPNICSDYLEMLNNVDGVIIARDDYATHFEIAKPFLEKGIFTFVDKPLALNIEELKFFKPYLENGTLMSCSGLYYAKEMESIDNETKDNCQFVDANVLNSWEKYGVHMLDAILGTIPYKAKSVVATNNSVFRALIHCENGMEISVNSLGAVPKTFNIRTWTENKKQEIEISNNFAAFKKTMENFVEMIKKKAPVLDPNHTLQTMKVLIAGNLSAQENREVMIDEINI